MSDRVQIAAEKVHVADRLVCRDGEILYVLAVSNHGDTVWIATESGGWPVPATRLVTVLTHQKCTCRDGVFYGRGVIENGVFKGFTGTCFRCNGTGVQTRADAVRNHFYDNHRNYA